MLEKWEGNLLGSNLCLKFLLFIFLIPHWSVGHIAFGLNRENLNEAVTILLFNANGE
jgi:hypothetical protein